MEELAQGDVRIVLALLAVVGIVYCFLGYRVFKLVLGLTGFLLAGGAAAVILGYLTHGHLIAMAVAGVIGGLCGAFALFFLYRVGVFCLGFLGAGVIAYQLVAARPEAWAPWAALGAAFLGGLIALGLERPAMSIATAAIGAWLILCSALMLALETGFEAQLSDPENAQWLGWGMLGAWGLMAVIGAGFQLSSGRGKKNKQKQKQTR